MHYIAERRRPGVNTLFIIDEFNVLRMREETSVLFEQVRSFGGSLIIAAQGVALRGDDQAPSEGAHLLKEDTRLFPHAQDVELVDDEESVDTGAAALGNVVHERYSNEPIEVCRGVQGVQSCAKTRFSSLNHRKIKGGFWQWPA